MISFALEKGDNIILPLWFCVKCAIPLTPEQTADAYRELSKSGIPADCITHVYDEGNRIIGVRGYMPV